MPDFVHAGPVAATPFSQKHSVQISGRSSATIGGGLPPAITGIDSIGGGLPQLACFWISI
jgi:hypothetical protein